MVYRSQRAWPEVYEQTYFSFFDLSKQIPDELLVLVTGFETSWVQHDVMIVFRKPPTNGFGKKPFIY